ncbi:hypothetical protein AB0K14_14050 [Actinosynnema sp. NPDC050801]|uniref:hypothetical protein n=1 Tax=unclassified Actinosynnema TaxID=2637065 RepID=UPI00340B3E51
MTTYYDDVDYIEDLDPDSVERNSGEFQRLNGLLGSVVLDVTRARKNVVWESESGGKYDSRMSEAEQLVDGLGRGFARAGAALLDYAADVQDAKRVMGEGVEARNRLKALIASSKLAFMVNWGIDPMRVWEYVRSLNVVLCKMAGIPHGDVQYGNRLYHQADTAFHDALTTEKEASRFCADALRGARAAVPDFRGGNFAHALWSIKSIPAFATAVRNAADHPYTQVPDERPRQYTDGPISDRYAELWRLRNALDVELLHPGADEHEWVKNNKQLFDAAAVESGIPPELLAAIMYREGEDWHDIPRALLGEDGATVGENQIQVRNAAAVLGYDPANLTPDQRDVVVGALTDPVMNVLIAAEFLEKIKAESDLADVPTDQLTVEDCRDLAARYNCGDDWTTDKAKKYADDVELHMKEAKVDLG